MSYTNMLLLAAIAYLGYRYYARRKKANRNVERKIMLLNHIGEHFNVDEETFQQMKSMPLTVLKDALISEKIMDMETINGIINPQTRLALKHRLQLYKDKATHFIGQLQKKDE